jgi:hypothetical protein
MSFGFSDKKILVHFKELKALTTMKFFSKGPQFYLCDKGNTSGTAVSNFNRPKCMTRTAISVTDNNLNVCLENDVSIIQENGRGLEINATQQRIHRDALSLLHENINRRQNHRIFIRRY